MQVGTGTRSEKIKTYNYKDSRVSDHRSKNNYTLATVLDGGLEDSIQAMITLDQQARGSHPPRCASQASPHAPTADPRQVPKSTVGVIGAGAAVTYALT